MCSKNNSGRTCVLENSVDAHVVVRQCATKMRGFTVARTSIEKFTTSLDADRHGRAKCSNAVASLWSSVANGAATIVDLDDTSVWTEA